MLARMCQVMARDAKKMRGDGPTIFAQVKHMVGIPEVLCVFLCVFVCV